MATVAPEARDRERTLRSIAWGRILFGALLVLAPARSAAFWVGADGRRPAVRALTRAFGGRDLAIGLGTLMALSQGHPTRAWAQLGVMADTGDAVATLLSYPRLPRRRRFAVLAAAAAGAVVGLQVATDEG